jgi:predicted PurR-regulated permease PerM
VSDRSSDVRHHIVFGLTAFFAGGILVWVLYLVRGVLLMLYIASLLAIGLSPVVGRLEHSDKTMRGASLPRWAAILILYTLIVCSVAAALSLVVPPLVEQARDLWSNLPKYADELQTRLVHYRLITHRYTWSDALKSIPASGLAVAGVLGALQSVVGAIGTVITILVLPYYLLLEAHAIQSGFLHLFRRDRRAQVARLATNVTGKVAAWLGGQLLLASIIGITTALGLWLLGVPYFYVLALGTALGELIPVVGPILAALPAILVASTVSVHTGLFTLVYFVVQQFIENHFLVPRVMQRQVGVSAVTVIASLLIGSELLGIVGALLAVPTAAITQVFVQEYIARNDD